MVVWKQYEVSRNCTSECEFWSFPMFVVCSTCSPGVGRGSEPQRLVRLVIASRDIWYSYNHYISVKPFYFSLSVRYPKSIWESQHSVTIILNYLCIWLCLILVVACGTFIRGMRIFSCGIWDLVPWSGIKPRAPALRAWSLSHWTTREVSTLYYKIGLVSNDIASL